MSPRKVAFYTLVLVALATLATPAQGGDLPGQFNTGFAQAFTEKPCPARDLPTFETLLAIPSDIAVLEIDEVLEIVIECGVRAEKNRQPVGKAKGIFESDLVLVDNRTGLVERLPVASGRYKTSADDGLDGFVFEVPADLFREGFESGDVSAWSYTRADFTNKKKVDNVALQCGVGWLPVTPSPP